MHTIGLCLYVATSVLYLAAIPWLVFIGRDIGHRLRNTNNG